MRSLLSVLFAFAPVRWLCAAGGRHAEQQLRAIFGDEPYRWRYTVFGEQARWGCPLGATSAAGGRDEK